MIIGNTTYHVKTSNNTLQWAKSHLDTAPDGSLFLAETLTAAKGRQGRSWEWMPGQLTATILLKPSLLQKLSLDDLGLRTNQLAMALSLGIVEPLQEYEIGLKWPNDFYLNGKKVGGMLIDISWRNNIPFGIVLGFAINVNNHFDKHHSLASIATSINAETGLVVDLTELLNKILVALNKWYGTWLNEDFDNIVTTWKQRQLFINHTISIHKQDGTVITGTLHDMLPNGDAILITPTNHRNIISFHTIHAVIC